MNGSNGVTFGLAHTLNPAASLNLYMNGILQLYGDRLHAGNGNDHHDERSVNGRNSNGILQVLTYEKNPYRDSDFRASTLGRDQRQHSMDATLRASSVRTRHRWSQGPVIRRNWGRGHIATYGSTGDLTDGGAVPSGSVSSITAGPCLGGGTITTSGTISSIGSCYVAGAGTANVQTATYSPAVTSLVAGLNLCWLPSNANSSTTPTFSPNTLTAKTIIKGGGAALASGDLATTAIACALYDGNTFRSRVIHRRHLDRGSQIR